MKKRLALILSLLLVFTLVFCACGNPDVTGSGGGDSDTSSGGSEAPVEIGYITWNGGAQQQGEEAFFDKYEDEHSNVKIAAQFVAYDNYYSKLNTLIAAKSCPDIFFTSESTLIDYAEKGQALNLKEMFAKDGIDMKSTFAEGCYYEDEKGIWSLSNGISTIVLYYNKGLFDEAGIKSPSLDVQNPWTWDEFREAAMKLTTDTNGKHAGENGFDSNSVKTYGVLAPTHRNQMMSLLYSNGGSYLVTKDGKTTGLGLLSNESKKVLQSVADMMLIDKCAPTAAMAKSLPSKVQMYKDNQLAMSIDGAWDYINFANEDYDVGIAPLPSFGKPVDVAWGSAYMLSSQSKNPEAAFSFLKDFLDPEVNPDQIKYMLPNKLELYEGDKLQSWIDTDFYNDDFKQVVPAIIQKTAFAGENVTVRDFAEVVDNTVAPILDKLWLGEAGLDAVLAEADAAAKALYN